MKQNKKKILIEIYKIALLWRLCVCATQVLLWRVKINVLAANIDFFFCPSLSLARSCVDVAIAPVVFVAFSLSPISKRPARVRPSNHLSDCFCISFSKFHMAFFFAARRFSFCFAVLFERIKFYVKMDKFVVPNKFFDAFLPSFRLRLLVFFLSNWIFEYFQVKRQSKFVMLFHLHNRLTVKCH